MKAGLYLRISQDQTGEGLGVTRQLEDCTALAERLGWDVVEVYTDNDVSATSGRARPAYKRLLADLKSGRVEAVIAWHPDRLYRRAVDLAELVDVVQTSNARVATVNAGEVDLASPTGLLVADMLAAIAMYEVRHKTERHSRSVRQGREQGRVVRTGKRLFGYTIDMQVIEHEAEVARRMATDVLDGKGLLVVARELNADGHATTQGTPWRHGTVRQYLMNPKLAGWSTLNGDVIGEGQWSPILDRETSETLRALLAARSGRDRRPRVALLGGLVFCGRCGERLITSGRASGERVYRCPKRPGYAGCGRVSGLAEPVEEVVEAYAAARLRDPRVLDRVRELTSVAGSTELLAEIGALEQRVAELDAELDKPGVPVARLTRALDRASERLEAARGELATATRAAASKAACDAYAGGLPWPSDLATRRDLVATALGDRRVWLDPSRPGARNADGFDPHRVRVARERDEHRPGLGHERAR